MGGVFTIQAIAVALIIIMCLLAFTVNYTKAYRAKNAIINILERNDGLNNHAACEIIKTLNDNNYLLPSEYESVCREAGYDWFTNEASRGENGRTVGFCIKRNYANTVGEQNQDKVGEARGAYYSIVTFVTFDVPIVKNILPISAGFFRVPGETHLMYTNHDSYGMYLRVQDCS